MNNNEEAVDDLVHKIGISGVIDGLISALHNQIDGWPEDDDGEPDAAQEWADRLLTLLQVGQPYAFALEGSHLQESETSASGTTIEIMVKNA